MRLTAGSAAWLFAGFCVVVAMILLLTWLRRRNNGAAAGSDDAWEKDQTRRRRKEVAYGAASYVLLFVCAAVAAALSFHGLVGFGEENLGLKNGWQFLVPFGLDGAAMFCSVLAVREASHGDAAIGSRALVWVFAAASAWFNWVHAPRGADHAGAPQFFAGMSISAALLFDRALKQTRKAALREQGLVTRPLPQIRMARWLRAPRETYGAWSLMLLEGVRSLDEAVEIVRDGRKERNQARIQERIAERQERYRQKALERAAMNGGVGHASGEMLSITSGNESAESAGADRLHNEKTRAVEPAPRRAALESEEPVSLPSWRREGREAGSHSTRESSYDTRDSSYRPREQSFTSRWDDDPRVDSASGEKLVDLTVDDDTKQLPRLSSLEERLKELERSFG